MSRKTKTQVEAELRIAQAKIAQLERALHDARPNLQEHSTSGDDSQQKERLRQLFEILPVGISVLDDERRIVFHNSALSRILEITAEGLQAGAYNNRKYLSADGSLMPMDESASARTIRSGEPTYNLETGIIKENGETIWTSVSTVPVDFPDWKTVLVTADITERKRTEKKLQESQRNFQLFVEYSPAAIAMFDRDMRYIAASRRYIADYHLPTSDVIGRSHYEIFPEIPERWKEIHRRCLAGAIETAEADPFPRLDGRLDWVRWEIHPWYESDGTISGIILFSEVITNRIELEQERAKLTERLDLATRSACIGIWDWDIQKNEVIWDERMYALYGLQPGEFGGAYEAWLHGVHPEDRESSDAAASSAVSGEREYDTEFRVLWRDGSVRWLKANGQVFRNESGTPLRMVGVSYDITERKQAEEALKESEARFSTAFFTSPISQSILSRSTGRVVEVNNSTCSLFEYQREELIGADPGTLQLWANSADQLAVLDELERTGHVLPREITILRKSGEIRTVLFAVEPIAWKGDSCLITSSIDITERKQAEAELRLRGEVMANMAEGVALIREADAIIAYTNPKYDSMFGYGAGELNGKSISIVNAPTLRHANETALEIIQALREHGTWSGETHNLRKNGETFWCWTNVSRLDHPEYGRVWVTVQSDISERKATEEALRESNERFRQIAGTILEVFWIFDNQNKQLLYVSPGLEPLWGRSIQDFDKVNSDAIDAVFPEDLPLLFDLWERQNRGEPTDSEFRIRRGTGETRWVHSRSFPVLNEHGVLVRTTGIVVDITNRKQVEQDALYRQQLLEKVIQLGKKIAAITDLEICLYEIYQSARFGLDFDRIGLFLYDETIQHVLGVYGTDRTGEVQTPGFYDAPIDGFGGWQKALQSSTGIAWQEEYQKHFDLSEDHEMYGVRNHIIVAAWAGEKPVALITADNLLTDRDIKPADIEALQLFAGYAGLAIENATLQTELELKVEERTAEVQDLYDNAPTGYHSLDTSGCVVKINATELKWLGYAREEVIGRRFIEFITEESAATFRKNFPGFLQRGWVRDLEFELVCKDGSTIPVLVSATAIFDASGNFVMSRSTVFDITEQRKAAEALKESEARYRKAISAADAIPYSFDYAANTYTFIGENVERLTGYSANELTPELLNSLVLEIRMRGELAGYSAAEATQRIRNRELPGNVLWQSDIHIRNTEGNDRWWSDVAVQILNEQNTPVGTIGILQDITERMEAEETLRLANIELERALRMKDEFLASISHELRTPLTGILGLSEALQYDTYGILNQKQKSVIGNIENNGHHLLELINDILDISKMEAGKFELEMSPCQLSDICQSSLQLVKGMAHKKGQNMAFSMNPASIIVQGDARRLKQIIVNLLSNAVKYSPEHSPIGLEVTADRAAQNVQIQVWDKGMGIDPKDMKRLFQPFVQLDSSLSRQQTGTGLGLALVQRLVEMHGGMIHLDSAPGQGSRFIVTLPYLPGETEQPVELPSQIHRSLIVEDSVLDADRLTRFLKQLGIHSTILPKGAGVVEKALALQPGVILLDINLPDVTGWDVLEQLKQNKHTRNIPVIITSIEEDREKSKQLGAAGYLVKLFTMDELRFTLSHIPKPEGMYKETALVVSPEVHLGTVMLVDDNETNILMIEDFLRSKNYNVFSSRSGIDFLEKVTGIQPDIVLMDVQMPDMDGLETIRRLRLLPTPEPATVPVIAITALAMPGDRERCIEAGADEYISKPIRLKGLVTMIQKMLADPDRR